MKKFKIILTLILSISSFSISYALGKGPLYRDYLVTNQPMPNSLLWKYDLVSEPTDFIPQNDPAKKIEIHHKQGIFELYPILTTNYENSLTSPGFGIMTDNFNDIQNSELSEYYSGAYVNFFGIGRINSHWYGSAFVSYGNFSDKKVKFNSQTDKTLLFLRASYKRSANEIYKFGLLYNSNFGDDVFIPTLGVSYSWDTIIFDALLPSYVNVRFIHSKKLHTVIGTEVKYSSYYDSKKQDVLEIVGVDFDVHAEYNFYELFWAQAGIVYGGEKDLEWLNSDTRLGTVDAAFKINAGITAHF